jgi:hypothetical protein
MRAYASKHRLSPEQAVLVRAELSSFIAELLSGKRPQVTMVPETANATAHPPQRRMIDPKPV